MTSISLPLTLRRRNWRSAIMGFALAAGMVSLGFAAVPLYELFCRVTGFGGTPQIVDEATANGIAAGTQTISVRFDANTHSGLPWKFAPEQVTDRMVIGTRDMAIYTAENLTDTPITGRAGYNITPAQAGKYFNKIQCFCFTQQTLEPGQKVRMPVLYYIDPAILEDEDTKDIEEITLSYTFYRVDPEDVEG